MRLRRPDHAPEAVKVVCPTCRKNVTIRVLDTGETLRRQQFFRGLAWIFAVATVPFVVLTVYGFATDSKGAANGVLLLLVRANGLDGAGDDLLDLVPGTRIEGEVFRGSGVAVDRVYGVYVGGGEVHVGRWELASAFKSQISQRPYEHLPCLTSNSNYRPSDKLRVA